MKITVTRDDIAWSIQLTSTQCGIAVALKEIDPNIVFPRVTHETIAYTDRRTRERITFPTPPHVAKWIDSFDRGQARPITFTLDESQAKRRPIKNRQPSELAKAAADRQANSHVVVSSGVPAYRPLRDSYTSTTGTVESARSAFSHRDQEAAE